MHAATNRKWGQEEGDDVSQLLVVGLAQLYPCRIQARGCSETTEERSALVGASIAVPQVERRQWWKPVLDRCSLQQLRKAVMLSLLLPLQRGLLPMSPRIHVGTDITCQTRVWIVSSCISSARTGHCGQGSFLQPSVDSPVTGLRRPG